MQLFGPFFEYASDFGAPSLRLRKRPFGGWGAPTVRLVSRH
jgi:hypothetical protein